MKPDQQNIAIAKACGWNRIRETAYGQWGCSPDLDMGLASDNYLLTGPIPDYINDLNAMHEAVKVLTDPQKVLCYHMISDIVGDCGEPTENCFNVYHATAAQRAEALLRTLKLWTEV